MADVSMDDASRVPRGPRKGPRNRPSPYARPAARAAPATGVAQSDSTAGSTRLMVSNLHYEVTEQDLNKIFSQVGTLARAPSIRFDRSGRSTGVAHVTYNRHEDALRAKQKFDGVPAKGQPLEIRFEAAIVPPAGAPTAPRGAKSLLARLDMNGGSLLSRISAAPAQARATPAIAAKPARAPRAPVAPGQGKGRLTQKAPRPPRVKTKTVGDLDKELDAYLADEPKKAVEDTEMAA